MYKAGDEVLIKAEITDVVMGGTRPYFVKPDSYSINWVSEDKIIPMGKTYAQGLEDAWELAKKIISDEDDGLDLDEDTVDTIGGWILNEKYDIKVGEEITYKNTLFKVIQKEKNSIEAIDIFLESVTEE